MKKQPIPIFMLLLITTLLIISCSSSGTVEETTDTDPTVLELRYYSNFI